MERVRGIFERLLGEWSFEREVRGRARMSGDASFSLIDGETAIYEEDGEVRLEDGQTVHGKQSYVYEKKDGGFAVLFRDTRKLFHVVTFWGEEGAELTGGASHLCKEDLYVSRYTIRPEGRFEVCHLVYGPHKDYSIRTVYRRRLRNG